MKRSLIRRFALVLSASALIFSAVSCNPNRNNPNYSGTQSQPGAIASPGASESGGNTGSISGAGDASNTGSSSSTGSSSGSR